VDEPIASSPTGWPFILEFFKFAVPFFLATAFYFNFQKQYDRVSKPFPLGARLLRLWIPYCLWSIIYLAYKVAKYWVDNDTSKIGQLFQDPFQLIFTGGAAFQLYFIPLLMTGTLLVWLMIYLTEQKLNPIILSVMTIVGMGLYEWLITSGNSFNNNQGIAFQGLIASGSVETLDINFFLRTIAILFAWLIRCFPYITIAMLFGNPDIHRKFFEFKPLSLKLAIVFFILINSIGIYVLPTAVYEVLRGYSSLVLAILVSPKIPYQKWINDLGNASFGIYLIHLILVESTYIVLGRLVPTWIDRPQTFSLLFLSLLILLGSWMLTTLLNRIPRVSKILFGA